MDSQGEHPTIKIDGEEVPVNLDEKGEHVVQREDMDGTDLPELVLVKLVSYFDLDQKKTARLVCHSWKCEAERSLKFNATLNDSTVDFFLRSLKSFDQVSVTSLTKSLRLVEPCHFMNGLKIRKVPKVISMRIEAVDSDKWVLFLLGRVSRYLEHLEFKKCLEQMTNYTVTCIASKLFCLKLNKLTFDCDLMNSTGFERAEYFFINAKFPLVKNITIEMNSQREEMNAKFIQLCIDLYRFLLRHSFTLTELHCTFESSISWTRYRGYYNRCVREGILGKPTEGLHNLKFLHFETKRMEMNDFARTIMNPTNKLETFIFIQDKNPYWSDMTLLGPVLERNGKTLENITIEYRAFDAAWLKPCVALKKLSIAFIKRRIQPEPIDLPALTHIHVNHLEVCFNNVFNLVVKDFYMKNLQSITFGPGCLLSDPNLLKRLGEVIDRLGNQLTQVRVLFPRFNLDWFKSSSRIKAPEFGSKDIFVNLRAKPFDFRHSTFLPKLNSVKTYDSRRRGEEKLEDEEKETVKVQGILHCLRTIPNCHMDVKILKFKEISNGNEGGHYDLIEVTVTRKIE